MALFLQSPAPGIPRAADPDALLAWLAAQLADVAQAMRALVELNASTRATRSEGAERAVTFVQAAVTDAAAVQLATLVPAVIADPFTTAVIAFDSASGLGRYRMDGTAPTVTTGMPIAAGGMERLIVGAGNIRQFAVIAEAGAALTMSVTLFR